MFLPSAISKKERPFSLEIFRHTGHLHHLLARAGFADLLLKIENAQHLPKLFAFGAILDVFIRYEGLYDGGEYNFVAYGGKARYLLLCGNRKVLYLSQHSILAQNPSIIVLYFHLTGSKPY